MVPVLRQHGDDARVWTETRGSSVPRLGCRLGEHVLVGSIKGWVFAAILPLHELRDLSGQSLKQDPAAGLSPKRGAWSMGCASGALRVRFGCALGTSGASRAPQGAGKPLPVLQLVPISPVSSTAQPIRRFCGLSVCPGDGSVQAAGAEPGAGDAERASGPGAGTPLGSLGQLPSAELRRSLISAELF